MPYFNLMDEVDAQRQRNREAFSLTESDAMKEALMARLSGVQQRPPNMLTSGIPQEGQVTPAMQGIPQMPNSSRMAPPSSGPYPQGHPAAYGYMQGEMAADKMIQDKFDAQREAVTGRLDKQYNLLLPKLIENGLSEPRDQIANKYIQAGKQYDSQEMIDYGEALKAMKIEKPEERMFWMGNPAGIKVLFDSEPEFAAQNFGTPEAAKEALGNMTGYLVMKKDAYGNKSFDGSKLKESAASKPIIKKFDVSDGKNIRSEDRISYDGGKTWEVLAEGKRPISSTGRYVASDAEVQHWANMVRQNRYLLSQVPKYGGLAARVGPEVERLNKNNDPINYIARESDVKAGRASQQFTTKQLDISNSFINTIELNIDQLKQHIKDAATRHSQPENKLFNMTVREYNNLVGDADINIYDMLVNAISTETAKLVSGGAGSVAQVAEGARIEMDKIHNRNLPIKEMLKLLEATRREGSNRIKALEKTTAATAARSRETAYIPKVVEFAKIKTRREAIDAIKDLIRRGVTKAKIAEMARGTIWESEL